MRKRKAAKKAGGRAKSAAGRKETDATGTYMFDKATGKIVKVSGRIPGLSHSNGSSSSGNDGDSGSSGEGSSGSEDFSGIDLD